MKWMDYIRGLRKGKEAHRIEREAMNDPFLSDALEGFDSVKGDHARRVEELQERFAATHMPRHRHLPTPSAPSRHRSLRRWSIAASLLVAVLGGSYLLWMKAPETIPHKELSIVEEKMRQESALTTEQPFALKDKKDSTGATDKVPGVTAPAGKTSHSADLAVKTPSTTEASKAQQQYKVLHVKEEHAKADEQEQIAAVEVHREVSSLVATPLSGIKFTQQDSVSPTKVAEVATVLQPSLSGRAVMIRGTSSGKRNEKQATLTNASVSDGKIHGVITDKESGDPLAGATIQTLGKGLTATVSDTDGRFAFNAQENEMVVVRYIGYEPMFLKVDSSKNMLIALMPDTKALSETVVVGYGRQRGKGTTGSVATAQAENPNPEPVNGWASFREYLKENLKHPAQGECKDKTGKVVLSFLVNQNGRPKDIKVDQSLCPNVDREAIRLLKKGPDWKQSSGRAIVEISF